MSAIFRTIAAATKTISQVLVIAGVMALAIVIYTGFVVQMTYMQPWFRWINYLNPVAYAFEALLVNEMHGRSFLCTNLVPSYGKGKNFRCAIAGAVAGEAYVNGATWVETSYGYSYSHIWRNLGIILDFNCSSMPFT
jgi:ATP-binding cassette, subfamily G (WHITE), member 2, PDR